MAEHGGGHGGGHGAEGGGKAGPGYFEATGRAGGEMIDHFSTDIAELLLNLATFKGKSGSAKSEGGGHH